MATLHANVALLSVACNTTGGTGKFEGLQAALVVTIDPLKSNFDGISQVIGHKKGTYRFVKTN